MLKKVLFETRFGELFLEWLERMFGVTIIDAEDVDYLVTGLLTEQGEGMVG